MAEAAIVLAVFAPLIAYYVGKDEGLAGEKARPGPRFGFWRVFPFRSFYKRGRDNGTTLRRAREAERLRRGVWA